MRRQPSKYRMRCGGGAGAVPATIGIDNGQILVGMTDGSLSVSQQVRASPKVSSRDMGHALAAGGMGATTVASSMVAAHAAGIKHFCSAGIGGVHHASRQLWIFHQT